MAIYVFSKPGFAARQSEKLKGPNKRNAILIDCNINHDMKVEAIHALKDHSLFAIYIEILTKLDKETETYEVSKYHFDIWARRVFGAKNNNYKVEPKLRTLAENGLIDFRIELEEGQNELRSSLDQSQTDVRPESDHAENDARPELDPPSDTPETRTALRATKPTQQTNKQTSRAPEQENFVSNALETFQACGNPNFSNTSALSAFLARKYREFTSQPNAPSPTRIATIWAQVCEKCAIQGASNLKYYERAWEGELSRPEQRSKPYASKPLPEPSKPIVDETAEKLSCRWLHYNHRPENLIPREQFIFDEVKSRWKLNGEYISLRDFQGAKDVTDHRPVTTQPVQPV